MSERASITLEDAPREISTVADANRALKTIAVAEAAEQLWERAKDPEQLYKAIKAKLAHQAAYAAWRPTVAPKGRNHLHAQGDDLPAADPGYRIVHRWRTRLIGDGKMARALEDARHRCIRVCEQENMGTVRGTEGTGEFERYTPAFYIARAREVLGDIDLDPASSEYAQRTVQAAQYFTAEDDGLQREWHGRIWLNPPYHRQLAPAFISKLIEEISAGHVSEAIMLTNNSTDTDWFAEAAKWCTAICFTAGRIRFEVPNADPVLPTQGQAFFYFGNDIDKFTGVFITVGLCMRPA